MSAVSQMVLAAFGSVSETAVTWNPSDKDASVTLSNGDRDAAVTDGSFSAVRANVGRSSGKRYFEISLPTVPGSSRHGFGNGSFSLATYVGNSATSIGATTGVISNSGYTIVATISPAAESNGQYYMFAIDFATGFAWLGRDGSWLGSGNPAAGTGQWISGVSGTVYPATSGYSIGSARIHGNTSNFNTSPPSGFSAWGA